MGAALVFALATAARPEGRLALRWSDIDLDRGEARIQRVVQWRRKAGGGGFYFFPPKTKKSRPTLRISEPALKLLQGHRRAQMLWRLQAGGRYQQLESVAFTQERCQHVLPSMRGPHLTSSKNCYSTTGL